MPGFNGMGPLGCGPRTGRGLGYCYYPRRYFSSKNELMALEEEEKLLEQELEAIRREKAALKAQEQN